MTVERYGLRMTEINMVTLPLRIGLTVALAILLSCAYAYAGDWKELKSDHFIIYYLGDESFASETSRKAESYYDRIASDLGYSRYDKFWQWDDRAKIYLYRNHEDFLRATNKPSWVHGTAVYEKKEIISYEWGSGFFDTLLPHEMAHLIFRDFVGFPLIKGRAGWERTIPLWMDEGVAQWAEAGKRARAAEIVGALIKSKKYIPLDQLMTIYNDTAVDAEMSLKVYAEAVSLVGYLIKEYGADRFALFCKQLRDGKSVDEGLSFVYTGSIQNIKELESKWIKYYGG